MKMDIERQVYMACRRNRSCKSFLRRLILEWSSLIFPRSLVEVAEPRSVSWLGADF